MPRWHSNAMGERIQIPDIPEEARSLLFFLLCWYFTRSSWESQPWPVREMQRGGNEIHASGYGQTDGDDF